MPISVGMTRSRGGSVAVTGVEGRLCTASSRSTPHIFFSAYMVRTSGLNSRGLDLTGLPMVTVSVSLTRGKASAINA